ncbi:hypothetical protein [Burkholderia sp. IMCC1007]|uniref:hypothetical protein n=1 Tax=Burkholderia sp. IMCC1007 TaxID=3004104 RepID=UPI0022B52A5F|nr:hypothetical protein [Burkholderia sp. IMCC1007]
MGVLVINDLPESVDLDKQAMAAITGGARVRAHHSMLAPPAFRFLHTDARAATPARAPVAEATAFPARPTLLR